MPGTRVEMGPVIQVKPADVENTISDAPTVNVTWRAKARRIRTKSHGTFDATINLCKLCCNMICMSVAVLIVVGIITTLPVVMIIVGSVYLNDCQVQTNIPLYLIVAGSFGLLYFVVIVCNRVEGEDGPGDEEDPPIQTPRLCSFVFLLTCFLLAWFVAGNVWVYGIYGTIETDPVLANSTNYCQHTLYYFAFWQVTVCYIVLGLGVVIIVGACVISLM